MTDENENTERKIQISNHKDGTYTFQAFKNGKLVDEKKGSMPLRYDDIPNPEDVKDSEVPQLNSTEIFEKLARKSMTKEEIAKERFSEGYRQGHLEASYAHQQFIEALEMLIHGSKSRLYDDLD